MTDDDASTELEQHAVDTVRALQEDGATAKQHWVNCKREGKSVHLAKCLRCSHRVALHYARGGEITHVSCRPTELMQLGKPTDRLVLERVAVADLMTRNVLCVTEDLSLDAVMDLFVQTALKTAPVLDRAGALVGIVCESDVLLYLQANGAANASGFVAQETHAVGDVMTPFFIAMPEHTSVTRAAAVMACEHVQRVVVVSDVGEIVGILSASDILYWLARSDGFLLDSPRPTLCCVTR